LELLPSNPKGCPSTCSVAACLQRFVDGARGMLLVGTQTVTISYGLCPRSTKSDQEKHDMGLRPSNPKGCRNAKRCPGKHL